MKTLLKTGTIACLALATKLSAQTPQEEFKKINEERGKRSALIDYLKSEGKVKESKSGTLISQGALSGMAQTTLEAENQDRLRQFSIIAAIQGKSAAQVAKAFAQKMGVDTEARELEVLLRIHGSNTVGASLAPEMVRSFLKYQGYSDILTQKKGVESTISFSQPGKKSLGVIEIKAHGSSTAFNETSSSKKVGLNGRFCDLGMASRQIKSAEVELLKSKGMGNLNSAACEFPIALDGVAVVLNRDLPIDSLTVDQVAKIFAGKVKNWKEIGGPNIPIAVFARDDQSGTWDTFKSRVLKPAKLNLTTKAKRFEDSGQLVRNVAGNSGGIGFCGLAYVDSTVQGLAVSSAKGLTAFQPTRLTVKTQDYPLARLLYFYMPVNANVMARDFVKFTMSNEGQSVVDKVGLVGQGLSTKRDKSNADEYKRLLLANQKVPNAYKQLIRDADRQNSQANIRFALGSNKPDINSANNLERLAGFLAEAGNEKLKVTLIGFADNVGAAGANQKLSLKRASEVADTLRAKGVRNIEVAGFGEAMPVADNSFESGRAKNRRVEVWLTR